MPVSLSFYLCLLSGCVSVCLSVCMSLPVSLYVSLYVCLSLCLPFSFSVSNSIAVSPACSRLCSFTGESRRSTPASKGGIPHWFSLGEGQRPGDQSGGMEAVPGIRRGFDH